MRREGADRVGVGIDEKTREPKLPGLCIRGILAQRTQSALMSNR
jgi:hypothetical protein